MYKMPYLVVCPASQIEAVGAKHKPSHMLTVMSEAVPVHRPDTVDHENHLALIFNDIDAPREGLVLPGTEHVEAMLALAREWDRQAPLLIHCYAGVSRSTASAYIIAHALRQDPDPIALASDLRFRSPTATPNAKLIAIGDVLLGMDGAMSSAIAEIGRGAYCFEGEPFVFPVDPEHDTMW